MSRKWRDFHSRYSPVNAGTVNIGDNNVAKDWKRLANENALINGVPVKTYCKHYNGFDSEKDVRQFFIEVILKDVKNSDEKNKAADYLLTAFHQGGLMYPVSGAMSIMLSDNGLQERHTRQDNRITSITTTEHGFKIQEIYTVDKIMFTPSAIYPDHTEEEKKALKIKQEKQAIIQPGHGSGEMTIVEPDESNAFMIEAGASIDVNFANKSPEITVESNFISYGHEGLKSVLDKRNFFQVIVDYLSNTFGLNSVKVMTPNEPEKPELPEVPVAPEEPDVGRPAMK